MEQVVEQPMHHCSLNHSTHKETQKQEKKCYLVAIKGTLHQLGYFNKNILLRSLMIKHFVKREGIFLPC